MLLRRKKRKRSRLESFSFTIVPVLILAFEIWYLDSLYAKETQQCRVSSSWKSLAGVMPAGTHRVPKENIGREVTVLLPSSASTVEETTNHSISPLMVEEITLAISSTLKEEETTQPSSSPLRGEEKGGGVSNLCTSICAEKLHKEGG